MAKREMCYGVQRHLQQNVCSILLAYETNHLCYMMLYVVFLMIIDDYSRCDRMVVGCNIYILCNHYKSC
jgi:hypothetical protein